MATFPFTGFLDGTPYAVIPRGTTVVNVSSSSTLTTALSNAQPGHRIVLANGTYSGSFQITGKSGSSSSGISIEAATKGGAVFASGSTITVKDCSYVTIRELSTPYELSSGNLVQFRGNSHHCRVTRQLFGPSSIGSPGANKAPFIYMGDNCDHIYIDHCEIRNKANPGNAILGDGNFTSFQAVRHIRIAHNYIHDIRPEVDNEKEPIRLGVSTMSKTMSNSVIERNVFVNCIAEPEIVSAKAGGIRISGNAFVRCIGGPVYRHGVGGVVSDNYIIDRAQTFGTTIGSGGIRFYDKDHEVSYNYIDGVVGGNFQGALLLDTGDAEGSSTNLSGHWRVVNALVERNVLVGNPTGITIGDNYSSAPTGCNIRDNIVAQAGNGQAVTQLVAPVSTALNNNTYYATPAAGGLAQDSVSVWRKDGYGPRLTYLQAADVGVNGDLNETDGTGALVGGGGGPGPDPDPPPTGDVFVSPAGNDSNAGTSWALAKRTLGAGLAAASAGHTVLVGSGTYTGNFVTTKGGSSSGGYITLRSEVKHGAIITGVRTGEETAVTIDHPYVRLQDFTITSASGGSSSVRNGVFINASNVQVVGNHIHTCCQFLTEGTSWQGGAGIDTAGGSLSNVLIEGNLIHNIGLWSTSTQQLVHGIYMSAAASNGRVVNNVIYDCEDYGIHPYPQEEATGWVLANNTVAATGRGIRTGNNTIVRNNISYNNDSINFDVRGSGSVLSNNISGGTGASSMSGVTVANPLFVDFAGRDFRLQEASPARNAGTLTNAPATDYSGTQRPQSTAVDVGAYEMLVETGPPPTDTTTAAGRFGWGAPLPLSDEFDYTGAPDSSRWKLPGADWLGHNENGTRDPERVEVRDGRLIMAGLANGSTGWMQHKIDQQYGRWEVRCRSRNTASSNGNHYHPVLLIWPTSNSRQQDGEYDFLENGAPGEQEAGAFLHYPHPGTSVVQQIHFERANTDLTQWHNFALEWTPDHLKLFCDGELWGTASGGANSVRRNIQDMPSGHGTIQLDNFDGTSQTPAVFEVEWYRVYSLVPSGPPPGAKTVSPFGITSREQFGIPTITGAEPEPPAGSHATLLGSADTILPFTLGFTEGDGTDPPPAGSQTVSPAGVASGQVFGLPLLSVADGPQDVRAIGIGSAAAFGRPTITPGAPPPTAPGGVLVPSVYAVGRDGALTPLRDWTKLSVDPVRNSMGAFTLDYPAGGSGFSTLDEGVSAHPLRALEVRIWLGGSQEGALGGWLTNKAGDDLTPGSSWSFTGHFHEWLLSKAIVGPQTRDEANPKGELRFASATAGLVLSTLMDQAQARGALPLVTRDFSATHDSNGQPWPVTVSSLTFAPKTTVLQVADKLVELGMLEYELTAARVWRAYAAGTRGVDRTGGLTPLTFAHAVNLQEHSRRESAKDAGTAVLAAGSEGFYSWAESASAVAELGWRAEVGADAGQLESETAVQAAAATYLEAIRHGVAEFVGQVEFATGVPLPIVDWGVGDWAYTWVGSKRRRLRIAQIGIEFTQDAPPRGTVALNDLITDKVAALYKRLNAITSGDAVVGTSVPTPGGSGEDHIPPAAPTGLTLSSTIAFRVPGQAASLALVSAGWAQVLNDAYADAVVASKAQAATMIAARTADALVVGRIATDDATAGRVNAAEEIAQRLSSALDDQPNSTIFEDWTWQGAPAIVVQHHDALLDEFFAAGFSGADITLSEQALEWLRDYEGPTSYLYESWTWDGAPDIVHTYAPILKEEFEREHPDSNLPDFPEQVAVIAQAWLAGYALTHQGGGAVSGDVDHYRVNYTYLGGQPLTPQQQYEIDQGLLEDTTWVEPEGSPTRSTSLTFGNIEGGRSLGVRVCAVDRADNQGPWSATVAVDTAVDDLPPPAPSKPIASAWFRTMDIRWDGLGSSGEDMLAAAPDFASGGGLEIHVAEGIDFLPDRPIVGGAVDLSLSSTYKATLYAAGTYNVAGLTVGKTYFARFVAVDRAGNASGPSETSAGVQPQQLVSIDYGPGTIEGIHIKNAAIGNAQIANAAINSAKIEEVSAGLLTAGTMTANVTIGGRFETPVVNGNKLEFDNAGIRLYRQGTVIGRWQVSDATMLVTGTYLTGLSGERIELLQNGTQRFYGATGVDYAEIANDGGIVRFRSRPDSFGRRSSVDFDPTRFAVRYGTSTESRSRFDVGLTYAVLNAPVTGIRVLSQYTPDDLTESRFHFVFANAAGDINDSTLHYVMRSGKPAILAPGVTPLGAGIRFDNDAVSCVNGAGTDYVTCRASAFPVGSSELVKRDIAPARFGAGRTAREVIDHVPVYGFHYDESPPESRSVPLQRRQKDGSMKIEDVVIDTTPTKPSPRRFSVIAEHLESIAPELVWRDAHGDLVIDVADRIGVVWEAVRELSREVRELRGDAGPVVVEGSVQDPSRWLELPNGEDPSV